MPAKCCVPLCENLKKMKLVWLRYAVLLMKEMPALMWWDLTEMLFLRS